MLLHPFENLKLLPFDLVLEVTLPPFLFLPSGGLPFVYFYPSSGLKSIGTIPWDDSLLCLGAFGTMESNTGSRWVSRVSLVLSVKLDTNI